MIGDIFSHCIRDEIEFEGMWRNGSGKMSIMFLEGRNPFSFYCSGYEFIAES
jgi:hypothetical protein